MGLADTLATLRRKRGFTQVALAVAAGVDTATISRVECGKHVPHQRTLKKLESALGVREMKLVRIAQAELDCAREVAS